MNLTVELTDRETAELVLVLKHQIDAQWKYPNALRSQEMAHSIIAKMLASLGFGDASPWEEPTYRAVERIAKNGY